MVFNCNRLLVPSYFMTIITCISLVPRHSRLSLHMPSKKHNWAAWENWWSASMRTNVRTWGRLTSIGILPEKMLQVMVGGLLKVYGCKRENQWAWTFTSCKQELNMNSTCVPGWAHQRRKDQLQFVTTDWGAADNYIALNSSRMTCRYNIQQNENKFPSSK